MITTLWQYFCHCLCHSQLAVRTKRSKLYCCQLENSGKKNFVEPARDPRFVCFEMIMSLSLMFVIASRPGGVDVPVCRRFFLQSVEALCCPLEHYACSQVFLDVVCLIAEVTRFLAFSMPSLCSTPHLPLSMGISLLCPLAPSCARQNLKVFQFCSRE